MYICSRGATNGFIGCSVPALLSLFLHYIYITPLFFYTTYTYIYKHIAVTIIITFYNYYQDKILSQKAQNIKKNKILKNFLTLQTLEMYRYSFEVFCSQYQHNTDISDES